MDFDTRYKNLNKEQKRAVDTIDGPSLVLAGPGSGKTEILSMRVANILKKTDIGPTGILCLTFTESASLNMRDRLVGLIGIDAYKIGIYTFHSFCTDIIGRYPEYFFNGANFSPADDPDRFEILQKIFESLSYADPLKSSHQEEGFIYLKTVKDIIKDLKKQGILPEEFKKIIEENQSLIEKINPIIKDLIPDRISKKSIDDFRTILDKVSKIKSKYNSFFVTDYVINFREELKSALDKAEELDKTTHLSEWKRSFVIKDDKEEFVLKDSVNLSKILSLVSIYEKYQKELDRKKLFDFEDMILLVTEELKKNKSLVADLAEKYQYILVDEFQDTNKSQMFLLSLLTDLPVNEGRPNVMAVGDDDQSIYKFQGAEVENILFFKEKYKNPEIITLNKNYRSSQKILDLSEFVIGQSGKSLRNLIPEISKKIVSAKEFKDTEIHLKATKDSLSEYDFISSEIKKLIESGVQPKEIAVITRKHQSLVSLSAFLDQKNVPYSYAKKKNILNDPLILELIEIIYFLNSVANDKLPEANEYLPRILSFPFWQIEREKIWRLSLEAKNQSWLYMMLEGDDQQLKGIAKFLIDLGVEAKSLDALKVIDKLIGTNTIDEDEVLGTKETIKSPFKEFYFKKGAELENNYITMLSSLRVFINSLKEYKKSQNLKISDIVEMVEIYRKNDLPLLDQSIFSSSDESVSLLTAHSAKGLEFEVVFILSANDNEWLKSGRPSNISLPKNIKIKASNDDLDDKIRLFYVALTRAKKTLYITRHTKTDDGEDSLIIPFISHLKDDFEEIKLDDLVNHPLKVDIDSLVRSPFVSGELSLLKELVKDYKMPVTHFNNFLDVSNGGPRLFLEQNLLQFPQSKTLSGSFGTACHETIRFIYSFWRKEKVLPEIKFVRKVFEDLLKKERLTDFDYKEMLSKGDNIFSLFLKETRKDITEADIVEVDFKNQGVLIGEANLSGKIDRMRVGEGEIVVTDFKTGKPEKSFDGKDDYKKIKLRKYRQQLIFYKILIENSKDFSQYKVNNAELFFLEPIEDNFVRLAIDFTKEEVDKTKKLIEIVYQKIKNLDFPDITKYSPDFRGCIEFEEDLLK